MRKGITPVVGIILLSLMTVGAAVLGFVWISTVQENVQEGAASSVIESSGSSCNRLNVISMRGDGVTISNVGCDTISNVTLLINGELTNFDLLSPLSPGQASFILYTSLPIGESACVELVLDNGQSVAECVSADDAVSEAGFGQSETPGEGCQELQGSCTGVWFEGSITTKDNSTCACCGDSGANDVFYNGSISNTTSFCQEGDFANQAIDNNQTICEEWNNTWFTGDLNYYGTYSFTSEEVGQIPIGWIEGGYSVQVLDAVAGHKKVVELKGSGGEHSWLYKDYTGQESGTIEFWIRTDNIVKRSQVDFKNDAAAEVFWFYLRDSKFKYFDGSNPQIIPNVPDPQVNTWHHVVIHFECGSGGYMGLGADQAEWVIDGVSSGPVSFTYTTNNIGRTNLYADPTASSTYWDAIGYSWDPDYNIGDNSLPQCCGDDASDNFFTGYLNNATSFCYNGAIINQEVDANQNLCKKWNMHWLTPQSWWNSSFSNRKKFIIEEESGISLTNYQVQIEPSTYDTSGLIASYHFTDEGVSVKDYSGNGNDGILYGSTVNMWHFDEGAGSTVYDSTITSIDGTVTAATWTSDAISGNALTFTDASNSKVQFSSSVLNVPPYTICAWVKPDTLDSDTHYIMANGGESGSWYGFYMYLDINNDYFFGAGYSGKRGHVGTDAHLTSWTFVCGSWDGTINAGSLKIYVNGTLANSAAAGSESTGTAQNLKIGGSSTADTNGWDGEIDEVAFYDIVLTEAQITDLYNNQRAKFVEYTSGYNDKGVGLDFDGVDDYVALPNIHGHTDYTQVVWVKWEGGSDYDYILQTDDGAVSINSVSNCFYYFSWDSREGGTGTIRTKNCGSGTITPGEWTQIAVVASGTSVLNLYINGELEDNTFGVDDPSGTYYGDYIGAFEANSIFNGTIDEVLIYNRALDATEVSDLYTQSKGRYDYSDLRFVDSNNNELDYYHEFDNLTWVNVTSLPANSNTTIYMYYNNTNADEIVSNATNTFDLFDDFSNDDQWTFTDRSGINIEDGVLKVKSGTGEVSAYITLNTIPGYDFIQEYDFYKRVIASGSEKGQSIGVSDVTNQYSGAAQKISSVTYQNGNPWLNAYSVYDSTTETGTAFFYMPVDELYKIRLNKTGASVSYRIWNSTSITQGTLNAKDNYNFPYFSLNTRPGSVRIPSEYDNLRIRKSANPEPRIYTGAEEVYNTPYASCCGDDVSDNFSNNTNSCVNGVFS